MTHHILKLLSVLRISSIISGSGESWYSFKWPGNGKLLLPFLLRILAVCHGVMYKQLSAWMLHGLLLDQHEEFFIKQGPSSGNISAQAEEDEEDLGIGGLTGKQLRELQDLVRAQQEAQGRHWLETPADCLP